ncbi:unnamed protein product [Paramecium primaurelia]|uniref:Uncharacterized protein n=1 Tax=Paramecium primaurelia TaxID=5886 RepID=A0A8S1JUS9_PARPR|nr:unnamed protein product [Paramecium primaurelia]
MLRGISPDTMMVTFYDLDLPSNQSQKGFRLQYNSTVLDIIQYIKKYLDDDEEILLFFDKHKQFDGSLNTYVVNIIKQYQTRTIYYRKNKSKPQNSNQIQKSQKFDYDRSFDNFQQPANQLNNFDEKKYQSEYQLQLINQKNQQEQNSWKQNSEHSPQSPFVKGPSQQNYMNKIKISEQNFKSELISPQDLINKHKIIQNSSNSEYPKLQMNPQNLQIIYQSQQYPQELQQLKQEKQQIEQQYFQLQKDLSQIKNLSQVYEQQISQSKIEISNLTKEINNQKLLNNKYEQECQKLQNENQALQNELKQTKFNLQSQIQVLNKEIDNYKQNIQQFQIKEQTQNNINKLYEENQKLKNDNIYLQNELKQTKFNLQSQIEVLNNQRNNQNTQPKMKITQISPALEPKKDQFSIQNSQLSQSNYQNQNQQQSNYKNKCGHSLDISQIQQQVYSAIRANKIAQCISCQASIQSKLCLLIQDYGRSYLETKNQIELSQLQKNLQIKLKPYEKQMKCSNNNCQFFCIWQNYQRGFQLYNGISIQQRDGFCPSCLQYTMINIQPQNPISIPQNPISTPQYNSNNRTVY